MNRKSDICEACYTDGANTISNGISRPSSSLKEPRQLNRLLLEDSGRDNPAPAVCESLPNAIRSPSGRQIMEDSVPLGMGDVDRIADDGDEGAEWLEFIHDNDDDLEDINPDSGRERSC